MSYGAFDRRRLAGTELFVNVDKSVGIIFSLIFLQNSLLQSFVLAEKFEDLFVRTYSEGADKRSDRNFSVLVDTNVNDVVGIHFVFQPCAAVRDNGGAEQIFTRFILFKSIINSGRTYQLRYNNTLCAVDNESSAVGHKREIAHVDLALAESSRFAVEKGCCRSHCDLISSASRLTLGKGILGRIVKTIILEIEYEIAVVVGNRRHIAEYLFKSFFSEPLIRVFLHLDKVWHFQGFGNFTEAHSDIFSQLLRRNIHHRRKPPFILLAAFQNGCIGNTFIAP